MSTDESDKYAVEAILNHRKKGNGFQFLSLMKVDPSHDPECQPIKDFVDPERNMNNKIITTLIEKEYLENTVVE